MVSGAVLLNRQDSLQKCFARFARVLGALLVFSYGYYLYDAWVYWGLWPRMIDLGASLEKVWTQQITDGFWYLYFYMGLMLMLPLLQRLSCAMQGGDVLYLTAMCLGFGAFWPLIEHMAPALALPVHFDLPLFSTYIGLFFAGWWIRKLRAPKRRMQLMAAAAIVVCILLSLLLLRRGYTRDTKYWMFMDDRMHPGFLIVAASIAFMILLRGLFDRELSPRAQHVWTELGGCAFGVYLLQDLLIEWTEKSIYLPLSTHLTAFPAVILWEMAVFAAALVIAFILRRVPGLKKLI